MAYTRYSIMLSRVKIDRSCPNYLHGGPKMHVFQYSISI